MAPSVVCLISILSLLFLVQESYVLVSGDAGLIRSICQQTRLPGLCESSLNADPASKEADAKGLAKTIINAGESSASDTYRYILDELVKSYTDIHAVKVVTGCSTFYDNSKSALEVTVEDLGSDHFANALRGLILGFSYADDCKNSFSSAHPPLAYPDGLALRQRHFQNLCAIANDIIEVIKS